MNSFKIGIVANVSGIYRKMAHDFKNGLQLAVDSFKGLEDELKIEYSMEVTAGADNATVSNSIFKLINSEDADLITGIINNNVLATIVDGLESKQVPFIINNLGEFIPKTHVKAKNLFGNSLNLWQSQYALGKWSQKKYNGVPHVYYSIYDAGYQIGSSFRMGALDAGAEDVIFRLMQLAPGVIDTSPIINQIIQDNPSHAHIILCGVDAKDFLRKFKESGLEGKVPITVSPFVVDGEPIEDYQKGNYKFPNAITWCESIDNESNKEFVQQYEIRTNKCPNVFSLLGYETGLAIGEALLSINNKQITSEKLIESLEKIEFDGPRGRIRLNLIEQDFDIIIRALEANGSSRKNEILHVTSAINALDKKMITAADGNVSGWENPYLCI